MDAALAEVFAEALDELRPPGTSTSAEPED